MTRTVTAATVVAMVVMVAVGAALPVAAAPSPPAAYYGTVTVGGDPAPAGTTIQTIVDGEVVGEIVTREAGQYGGSGTFDEKLKADLASTDSTSRNVEFRIASTGDVAQETVAWQSATVERVDLTFPNGSVEDIDTTEPPADTTTEPTTEPTTTTTTPENSAGDGSTNDDQTNGGDTSGNTGGSSGGADTSDGGSGGSASSSGGGGGGGGGGGQGGSGPAPGSVSVTNRISADHPSIALDGGLPLSHVGFLGTSSLSASVSVQELGSPPGNAPDGTRFVTGARIVFESGREDDVQTVVLAVEQSTLDAMDVAADQLVVAHYDDQRNRWDVLNTTVEGEQDGEVVLSAPSAGFSAYAVFAEDQPATTTTTTTVTTTTTAEPTSTTADTTTVADETTDAPTTTTDVPDAENAATGLATPGFTPLAALFALLAAALLVWRRR